MEAVLSPYKVGMYISTHTKSSMITVLHFSSVLFKVNMERSKHPQPHSVMVSLKNRLLSCNGKQDRSQKCQAKFGFNWIFNPLSFFGTEKYCMFCLLRWFCFYLLSTWPFLSVIHWLWYYCCALNLCWISSCGLCSSFLCQEWVVWSSLQEYDGKKNMNMLIISCFCQP